MEVCVRGKGRREDVYLCSALFGREKEMLDFYHFELSIGFGQITELKCNKQ